MGRRAESWDCSEEVQGKPYLGVWIPDEDNKEDGDRVLSAVPIKVQQAMGTTWNTENFLSTKDYFLLVPQQQSNTGIGLLREAGVSVLGHNWEQSGHGAERPPPADPAWRAGYWTRLSAAVLSNLSYFADSGQKQYKLHIIPVSYMFPCNNLTLHFHEKSLS